MKRERGSAAVEFALIAPILLGLLTAILSFGHLLHTLQLANEALRAAARIAVVCDLNAPAIRRTVEQRVPQLALTDAAIQLQYFPAGCDRTSCQAVTVSLNGATYQPFSWFLPAQFQMPPFATTLPRESLESVDAAGERNPACI